MVDLSSFPPLFYSMHPAAQATGSRESGEGEGGAFQHLPTIQELCLRFEAECRKRDLYRTVEEASGGPDMVNSSEVESEGLTVNCYFFQGHSDISVLGSERGNFSEPK